MARPCLGQITCRFHTFVCEYREMKIALIAALLLACPGCQSFRTIKVSFGNADKVKRGDIVLMGNTKIGAVRKVTPAIASGPATIAILLDNRAHIPRTSEFILCYDAFGTPFISINPSGDQQILDLKQVQRGKVRDFPASSEERMPPNDTSRLRPSKKD